MKDEEEEERLVGVEVCRVGDNQVTINTKSGTRVGSVVRGRYVQAGGVGAGVEGSKWSCRVCSSRTGGGGGEVKEESGSLVFGWTHADVKK